MQGSPEGEARIAKIQRDVEELKEAMRDNWYDRRETFEKRISKVLSKFPDCVSFWLEIDEIRSRKEIEDDLRSEGKPIPHTTMLRTSDRLLKAGLIRKIGTKGKSPIFSKKLWAKELNLDEYVRKEFVEKQSEA